VSQTAEAITDILRGRVLRGLQAGTLNRGDRLASARDLAGEFGVDYRAVIAAYKALSGEGLVELRPRGGVYVAGPSTTGAGRPLLPEGWFAEILTQGLAREIPGPDLHEWLRRCTETLRLRAVVVTSTTDQGLGLCRELRDDFGFEPGAVLADELRAATAPPLAVRRADLLVTTAAHGEWVGALGAELRKPVTVVAVRPDLVGGEWAMLLRRPVYVVVATQEFGETLRRFFADVPGIENLRVLVYGRDDLEVIPEGAPTYVTQQVRNHLGGVRIPGLVLPAARTIASESARELFLFIVRANVEATIRRER
jgi:DNA-binding transcriptional regulator YhcF (GntR family)